MKLKTTLLVCLSIAALAVGCNKPQSTSTQLEKVQTETKGAAEDIQDYTYAQKGEFVDKMQGQLADINRELDQISAKIEKSSAAVQADSKPKLQALREQTSKLGKQLEGARNATESSWTEVKAGFKTGYADLKGGFKQARLWVSEKIAP